ncbi:hypothetical protein TanjilG_18697 [Lupinus angustifolius]|uniref:Uncharacterized protein n=1 Tax=Lupinus angustifolius TaxID=3871 RepID=A0A1J7GGH5_LUPAN|nr:hypothetical protein TanjilG_18697 [Lupinus angustifolius]
MVVKSGKKMKVAECPHGQNVQNCRTSKLAGEEEGDEVIQRLTIFPLPLGPGDSISVAKSCANTKYVSLSPSASSTAPPPLPNRNPCTACLFPHPTTAAVSSYALSSVTIIQILLLLRRRRTSSRSCGSDGTMKRSTLIHL